MSDVADDLYRAIHLMAEGDHDDIEQFLREMLVSERAGARSAAASALGGLGKFAPLAERLPLETNKIVLSVIKAHLRVAAT